MRRFLALIAFSVLSATAWAADPPVAPTQYAADPVGGPAAAPVAGQSTKPVATAATAPAQKPARAARETAQQHFARANTAHNGHLTLAESKVGYPLVAKNFQDIDTAHRGYVTEDDLKAWRAARKTARRLARQHETQPHPAAKAAST